MRKNADERAAKFKRAGWRKENVTKFTFLPHIHKIHKKGHGLSFTKKRNAITLKVHVFRSSVDRVIRGN